MVVRAKFTVVSITDRGNPTKVVRLEPRYDPAIPEDQRFCAATPWGNMEMSLDSPAAAGQFRIGQAFYVDFTPVE